MMTEPLEVVGTDLYQELQQKRKDLDKCILLLRENGTRLADAERAYKVRLRAECLALRDEGMPVTLIQLVVYGVDEVAELRHERDVCQVIYDANRDAENSLKLQIRVIQSQLNAELSSPGLGYGVM